MYYIYDEQKAKETGWATTYRDFARACAIDLRKPVPLVTSYENDDLFTLRFEIKGGFRDVQVLKSIFRPHVPEPFNESDYL